MCADADATGTVTWCTARLLAAAVARAPDGPEPLAVRGRSVLELGAGTGELSLALARAGARAVVATDLPQRVPTIAATLARARVRELAAHRVVARPLPFGDVAAARALRAELGQLDAVVASEVLYWPSLTFFDEDTLEPLVATLLALCGADEWRCPAVIIYKQREAGREARFVALSRAAGFEVREICLMPPLTAARSDGDSAAAAFADPDPPDGPGLDAVRCLALEWTPPATFATARRYPARLSDEGPRAPVP